MLSSFGWRLKNTKTLSEKRIEKKKKKKQNPPPCVKTLLLEEQVAKHPPSHSSLS